MLTIYLGRDILSTIHLFQLADPDRRSPTTCSGAVAMATVSSFLFSVSRVYPMGEWEEGGWGEGRTSHAAGDNSSEGKTTAWTRRGLRLPARRRKGGGERAGTV